MLCLGDSGNGKTTLLKNLARGAIDDGVSVIIPDTSESYLEADIKEWKNTEYYNVIFSNKTPAEMRSTKKANSSLVFERLNGSFAPFA